MALYPNTPETIEAAFNSLQEALRADGASGPGATTASYLAQPGRYSQLIASYN
jgi:hypothetical protein